MRFLSVVAVGLLLTSCSHFAPLGGRSGNLTEVAVYAPAGLSQSQLQEKVRQSAAITTINNHFEKFEMVTPSASDKSILEKLRMKNQEKSSVAPTTTAVIKMYKAGEQAPAGAVDAKATVTQSNAEFK